MDIFGVMAIIIFGVIMYTIMIDAIMHSPWFDDEEDEDAR